MIILAKAGHISNLGLQYNITQARDLLANFGIDHTFIASGRFKSSNRLLSEKMDEVDKHHLEGVLDALFSHVLEDIRQSRYLSQRILPMTDGRIINADEALEKGLVDHLAYWSEVSEIVKRMTKDRKNRHRLFYSIYT